MLNETEELMRSVQALAQPAAVQVELFPNFVVVGDELVGDFDEALRRFKDVGGHSLTTPQWAMLESLDGEIERLSNLGDSDFWLDPQRLTRDPGWEALRRLAIDVLHELGWPNIRPGPSGAIYIGNSI